MFIGRIRSLIRICMAVSLYGFKTTILTYFSLNICVAQFIKLRPTKVLMVKELNQNLITV